MGYSKNIAVIKGLKEGFSADGGELTGLIKAELYGKNLNVEVTLINFAPLSEGRYVCAISDGANCLTVEGGRFEGMSELDTSRGFAALICYVNGQVQPIASGICGNFHGEALTLKKQVERAENLKNESGGGAAISRNAVELSSAEYNDEAISMENYYEYEQTPESQGAVRKGAQKKENGNELYKDEKNFRPVAGKGGGKFFERVGREIEGILKTYPKERALEELIENSVWVKIDYGDGKYYVFGILYEDDTPAYIGYGVPAAGEDVPESMRGLASFVPRSRTDDKAGYWIMYQDAATGESVKVS